jgi:type I restriction enzyme S subunit
MDAQKFLAEFGHIASSPGGVQQMRKLILQLAITGDLTQRVAKDAPASLLLEQNQDALEKYISNKQLKRQHAVSSFCAKDTPWTLPENWIWCRLGQVTNYGQTLKADYEDVTDDIWVLELEDIEKTSSILLQRVRAKNRKFQSTKNRFPNGAVLYGKLRPYLDKVLIANEPGVCTTEIIPISFFHGIDASFLRWYLKSPYFVSYASNSTHGMNLPRMGTDAAREAFFPFPPAHEQASIVTKVDELMVLCDKLEVQQKEREVLQSLTRKAVITAFERVASPHELMGCWSRLSTELNTLFEKSLDLIDLRGVILELAALGKLSELDRSDRPANAILDESITNKRKRIADGDMKFKKASATDVYEFEIPAPEHWAKLSLADLFQFIDYRGKTPVKTSAGVVLVTAKNVRPGALINEPIEYISEQSYIEWMTRGFPREGDLLITTEAPLGNIARINSEPTFALAQRVINLQPFAEINTKFFMYFMMSPSFQKVLLENSTGMTAKGIKAAKLKQLMLSVPPREEQDRIVQRVEKLFECCDKFATQLDKKLTLSSNLAKASVEGVIGIGIVAEKAELKTECLT